MRAARSVALSSCRSHRCKASACHIAGQDRYFIVLAVLSTIISYHAKRPEEAATAFPWPWTLGLTAASDDYACRDCMGAAPVGEERLPVVIQPRGGRKEALDPPSHQLPMLETLAQASCSGPRLSPELHEPSVVPPSCDKHTGAGGALEKDGRQQFSHESLNNGYRRLVHSGGACDLFMWQEL